MSEMRGRSVSVDAGRCGLLQFMHKEWLSVAVSDTTLIELCRQADRQVSAGGGKY